MTSTNNCFLALRSSQALLRISSQSISLKLNLYSSISGTPKLTLNKVNLWFFRNSSSSKFSMALFLLLLNSNLTAAKAGCQVLKIKTDSYSFNSLKTATKFIRWKTVPVDITQSPALTIIHLKKVKVHHSLMVIRNRALESIDNLVLKESSKIIAN